MDISAELAHLRWTLVNCMDNSAEVARLRWTLVDCMDTSAELLAAAEHIGGFFSC